MPETFEPVSDVMTKIFTLTEASTAELQRLTTGQIRTLCRELELEGDLADMDRYTLVALYKGAFSNGHMG